MANMTNEPAVTNKLYSLKIKFDEKMKIWGWNKIFFGYLQ